MASKTRTRGARTKTVYRSRTRYYRGRRRYYRKGNSMNSMMPALVGAFIAHYTGGQEYITNQNLMIDALALCEIIPGMGRAIPWKLRKAAKGYSAMRLFGRAKLVYAATAQAGQAQKAAGVV